MVQRGQINPKTVPKGKVAVKATMNRSRFSRMPVDIIVPFHGRIDRLAKLIETVLLHTRTNPYQICLVDDASANENFIEQIKKAPQVFTVRSDEQLGFAGACELGFANTKQPYVVFMHSDCYVADKNWLVNLLESLYRLREQKVQLVSARTNEPLGGDPRLKIEQQGVGVNDPDMIANDFLPLHCAICPRDLFPKIGGFLKHYPYGMYEDEELYYRMKHYGFKQAISGKSWVFHEGGATIEDLIRRKPHLRQVMEANYEKCLVDVRKLRE